MHRTYSLNPFRPLLTALLHGLTFYAFDPKDPADAKILEDAIAEAVGKLDKKNKELLAELKDARKKGEIDPAKYDALESERDELRDKLAQAEKAKTTAEKAAATATEALKGEQGYTQRLLVDNGLNAALMEAGVKNPVHLKAAAALLRASASIEVKVDGEARKAVVGDKDLAAFVKEWSQSDDGKAFVTAPHNSGGGAGGGDGKGHQTAGNIGGNKDERTAAIAAKFPELSKQS